MSGEASYLSKNSASCDPRNTSQAAVGLSPEVEMGSQGNKVRRRCLSCQRSHRTCGDGRRSHACFDGVSSMPKHLEEVLSASAMDVSSSICSSNMCETAQRAQGNTNPQFVIPGEYSLLDPSLPANTISEQNPCLDSQMRCMQHSHRESTGIEKPKDKEPVIPDNPSLDDLAGGNITNKNGNFGIAPYMDEGPSHVQGASVADKKLGFTINEGWSSTFFPG